MICVFAPVFLIGGEEGLAQSAEAFVLQAGGSAGRVALLLEGGADPWKYVPRYVSPWQQYGLDHFDLIVPDPDGRLDVAAAVKVLRQATAIFIGGGNTAVYWRNYVHGDIGAVIRQRCLQDGIPYGGLSAGMLVGGEICPLDPDETKEDRIRYEKGLGLFSGLIAEPHFTGLNRRAALETYLEQSGVQMGFGVDDETCLLLTPPDQMKTFGGAIHGVSHGA